MIPLAIAENLKKNIKLKYIEEIYMEEQTVAYPLSSPT